MADATVRRPRAHRVALEERGEDAVALDHHRVALVDVVLDHHFDRRRHQPTHRHQAARRVEGVDGVSIGDGQATARQRQAQVVHHQPRDV